MKVVQPAVPRGKGERIQIERARRAAELFRLSTTSSREAYWHREQTEKVVVIEGRISNETPGGERRAKGG
jgi:hypothetical protein